MQWKAPVAVLAICAGVLVYQRYSLPREGERAFQRLGCPACHFSGAGPNLTRTFSKYDRPFVEQFIADPSSVYKQKKGESLNRGYMLMPNVKVTPDDAHAIAAYLQELNRISSNE